MFTMNDIANATISSSTKTSRLDFKIYYLLKIFLRSFYDFMIFIFDFLIFNSKSCKTIKF